MKENEKYEKFRCDQDPNRSENYLKKIKANIEHYEDLAEEKTELVFKKYNIKSFEDYPNLGAYVVFDNY